MTDSPHVRRLQARVAHTAARFAEHARGVDVADLQAVKLPWYEIRNAVEPDDPATVFVFDEIGGSFGVSADDFVAELEAITAPVIRVRINSPGGSVFDAIAMYNALNHHPARVEVYVDALAASAATIVAMAGNEIVMMPGSQMMIHDAASVQDGNAEDMGKMQTFLDRQSANIADIYRMRAGQDAEHWRGLMLAETWMFATEAVEMGLADRVEQPPAAPARDDVMTRAHDLLQFRYAGRRAAPAPGRKATRTVRRSAGDRGPAAQLRRDAATGAQDLPAGMSGARLAAFPALLRAELVERNGQQRWRVTGHASVVDRPYEMWDSHGPYMEVIDPGAFNRTLAARPDVAFLVNHRGVTMARTTNDTLVLSMDATGLAVEAWLNPKRVDVSDLVTAIEDRDVTEMSFAFMLGEGGGTWNKDFSEFRIRDLDLDRGDVSAVNYGANPYTDIGTRARETLRDLEHLPTGAARAALDRLQHRADLGPAEPHEESPDESATSLDDLERLLDEPAPAAVTRGRSLAHIEALLDA